MKLDKATKHIKSLKYKLYLPKNARFPTLSTQMPKNGAIPAEMKNGRL